MEETELARIELLVGTGDEVEDVLLADLVGVYGAVEGGNGMGVVVRKEEELDKEADGGEEEDTKEGAPSDDEGHGGRRRERAARADGGRGRWLRERLKRAATSLWALTRRR